MDSTLVKKKFMKRVNIDPISGCWNWQGYIKDNLTPYFAPNRNTRISAIRASFELYIGEIFEKDLIVRPTCGNKKCVNPEHIELMRVSDFARGNAQRTHCKRGHDLKGARIYKGKRFCRECVKFYAERRKK